MSKDTIAIKEPRQIVEPSSKGSNRKRTSGSVQRSVIFFSVLVAALFVLNQTFTLGLRKIKTSEFGVINKTMAGEVNAQILITGSSRAVVHYDPRIIQSITHRTSFNIGRNGVQTDLQLAFLKAYLKHNAKPEIVVHNLDPYTFVLAREIYDPAKYLPYLYEPELYEPLRKINSGVWKWKYLPLYGFAVEDMRLTWICALPGLLGIQSREDCFLGYNPRDLSWTGDFERFKAGRTAGLSIEIQPAAVDCLIDLIQTCRNQGIKVILVYSPEYCEMQKLTMNREEIFTKFRKLAEQFEIPFLDYSQSELCASRDMFYNSQHMNQKGAALFSRQIGQELAHMLQKDVATDSRRTMQP